MLDTLVSLVRAVDREAHRSKQTRKRIKEMTVELEELRAAVTANEDATAAAIARLVALADQLDALAASQVDGAELSALAQQIRDDNAELLGAVAPPVVEPEPPVA